MWLRSYVVGAPPCRSQSASSFSRRLARRRPAISQTLHCLSSQRARASSPCSMSWMDALRCASASWLVSSIPCMVCVVVQFQMSPSSPGSLYIAMVCSLQVAGHSEPLTAQAGDTLLSRSSSGTLSFHSNATREPSSGQQPQPDCAQLSHPQQAEHSMLSAKSSPLDQPPSCMDAELQWDAAILTVMVEGHADAGAHEGGNACCWSSFLRARC